MASQNRIQELLHLHTPPVALTFQAEAPPGVERIPAGAPAGCAYWKRAAEGSVFFTEAADHYGCPVGAYTHGIDLPPDTAEELEGLIGVMTGLEYVSMEDVKTLPRRAEPFRVAVYAPLSGAPVPPDVVLVRGNARQIMLLAEAAHLAGIGAQNAAMGRPACAVVPETLRTGRSATSLGCIGNRVYTGLADDEFYFAIPGGKLDAFTEKLETIVRANKELEGFHRQRAGETAA
jgi:uncharacterized protein (DUF169 family)